MSLDYRSFHLNLLTHAYNNLLQSSPFNEATIGSDEAEVLNQFQQLLEDNAADQNHFDEAGQNLLSKLVRSYPEQVPLIPRDLFWFFGGECLHFMPDDEIQLFQQLDEMRYEAESQQQEFNYEQARANLLGLH